MTKTLVNKIKFDGPKSHNQIIARIRTDMYKAGSNTGADTILFIVSSFFSMEGMFRDIAERKRLYSLCFGTLYPATKAYLKVEERRINKIKRSAAIRYLNVVHRKVFAYKQEKLIRRYLRLLEKDEKKNYSRISFENFLRYYKLKMPKYMPVSNKAIKSVMYKFDDTGKNVVRRGSKVHITLMIQRQAEERAKKEKEAKKKELLNQH